MKRSEGERRHPEALKKGERYLMRVSGVLVLVKVESKSRAGVKVTIEDGQFKSLKHNTVFRKGDQYTADPTYTDFFEPRA